MEVTKSNFEDTLPQIIKDIRGASFVCMDGEFTGLNNGHSVTAFDTPSEVYRKIRAGSLDFLFVQFGLSIFTQDDKTGRFKSKTYFFYLFPSHKISLAPDIRFLCQTSSISFLVSNNFDFNKLFKEGIPYLNSSDEANLAAAMETKRTYQANQAKEPAQSIPIPSQMKPLVDKAMKQIEKVVNGSEKEVNLGKLSGFVRKLIYQTYEETYDSPKGVILKNEESGMVCRQGEVEDKEARDAKELEYATGFSRVIREISAKGCLVVGHNMLLDICHLVHRFLDPLPEDYNEFKEMLHGLFPRIIDTKQMSADDPINSLVPGTTLESLLNAMGSSPFQLPEIEEVEGHSFNDTSAQYHNAGYDAFITGKIFLSLVQYLDPDNKKFNSTKSKPLEKYMNKLHLMKAPDTCIDLVNPDPVPQRDHVFHVSFPSSWASNNIAKLFSPFGSVQVFWLSDTAAWVSLHQREEGMNAAKTLANSRSVPNGVTVLTYHSFMKEKGPATSPRPNKRKSGDRSFNDNKKRRSSAGHDSSRNGSTRRISPIPEENAQGPGFIFYIFLIIFIVTCIPHFNKLLKSQN